MDLSINQRLKEFLTYKKISYETFRKMINCTHIQQISNWMAIREKIPDKYLIVIIVKLIDLDPRWLITGEGNMTNITTTELSENENREYENEKMRELIENTMNGFKTQATELNSLMHELTIKIKSVKKTVVTIQNKMGGNTN